MSTLRFVVVFSVIVGLVFPVFVLEGLASNGDVATLAISQAENVLASAYGIVLEAEQAGANVSSLMVQLNDAGEFLAKARVEFRLGNFDDAIVSANHCSEVGESVKKEADDLRVEVYGSRVMDSWLTVAGSLVGVVLVVFGSFWSWRVFKRRYYREVLRVKPEVAKAGS
jgi:hypothetical protein